MPVGSENLELGNRHNRRRLQALKLRIVWFEWPKGKWFFIDARKRGGTIELPKPRSVEEEAEIVGALRAAKVVP